MLLVYIWLQQTHGCKLLERMLMLSANRTSESLTVWGQYASIKSVLVIG